MPVLMFFLGFGPITHKKHSIHDFITDYEPVQDLSRAPVVAINHVSFLDIFYLYRRNLSFLAKLAVGKSPIFGPFAVARQCIFVNRSNKKDMSNILDRINQRIEENMENGNPPVIVFPEGTLSNGQHLLRFKRGAFMHNKPIKIMVLQWGIDDTFWACYTNIHPLMGILLFLSQLRNNLTVHELDLPVDPKYVWKKYGITNPETDPEAWTYVAKEVKDIMLFMTGF